MTIGGRCHFIHLPKDTIEPQGKKVYHREYEKGIKTAGLQSSPGADGGAVMAKRTQKSPAAKADGWRTQQTQIICVSFLVVIAAGTLLLTLPISSRSGRLYWMPCSLATSATCVTGLVVRDTWTQFSAFGQFVLLVLIQIGGLGLATLTSFAPAMRRRMGFRAAPAGRERFCRSTHSPDYTLN